MVGWLGGSSCCWVPWWCGWSSLGCMRCRWQSQASFGWSLSFGRSRRMLSLPSSGRDVVSLVRVVAVVIVVVSFAVCVELGEELLTDSSPWKEQLPAGGGWARWSWVRRRRKKEKKSVRNSSNAEAGKEWSRLCRCLVRGERRGEKKKIRLAGGQCKSHALHGTGGRREGARGASTAGVQRSVQVLFACWQAWRWCWIR